MSPIHWMASNGPMPERLNPANAAGLGDDSRDHDSRGHDAVGHDAGDGDAVDERTVDGSGAADGLAPAVHAEFEVSFAGGRPANAVAVGIDSVDVPRLAAVLERTPAMRERCFTTTELVDAATGGDEIGHLGTCFAAKEAVSKALGCGIGPVGFHDVQLVRTDSGAPGLVLGGEAASLAAAAGIAGWLVSATHTDTVAQTVVIAVGPDR
ncbi:MAG: holo-ACP synthase [Microthrixaceae bacterium]|nr:holo-ACP synthase [Microthrixaceae bacterium]